MKIRNVKPDDYEQIRTVLLAAFAGAAEAQLVKKLRQDDDIVVELVATQDAYIIGHILLSKMSGPVRTLGLAPVAVLPKFQSQGIGGALITESIAQAKATDWQAIFLLGHAQYYPRFGFSAKLAKPFASPFAGPNFMALELQQGVLMGKSGAVNYAPAFAAL